MSQTCGDGATRGQASAAGSARRAAAASWLPAATASGGTPPRWRLVRLGARPYDSVARQAGRDRPRPSRRAGSPPCHSRSRARRRSRSPARARASGVMRSPSQSHATMAANNGVAELKIAESAGRDRQRRVREAEERQRRIDQMPTTRDRAPVRAQRREPAARREQRHAAAARRRRRAGRRAPPGRTPARRCA